jgi:hypothetical protein
MFPKVEITDVQSEFKLFSIMNVNNHDEVATFKNKDNIIICEHDPRFKQLGYRVITKNVDNAFLRKVQVFSIRFDE